MRIALLLSVLMIGSVSARAEDFTGFYAGVHAGYAAGRERDREAGSVALPGTGAASTAETGLPPSAVNASQAMQDARSRSGRPAR